MKVDQDDSFSKNDGVNKNIYVSCIFLLSIASLVPFFFTDVLPFIDYPNHLARYFIIDHYNKSNHFAKFYEVDWKLIPNIGLDALIVFIIKVFNIELISTAKWVTAIFIVGIIPAVFYCHRMLFGYRSLWPMIAAPFAFNYVIIYGFTNYIAGLTCAIFLFGLWLHLRALSNNLARLIIFSTGAGILYIIHLYAVCIYAVIVVTYESYKMALSVFQKEKLSPPSALLAVLQFIPMSVMFFILSPTSENLSFQRMRVSSLKGKILAIESVFFLGSHYVSLISLALITIILFTLLLKKAFVIKLEMIVALLVLALLFVLMPFTMLGSGFADYRLPIAIFIIAIVSVDWKRTTRLGPAVPLLIILALFLVRLLWMSAEAVRADRQYEKIIGMLGRVPRGSSLIGILSDKADYDVARRPPVEHASLLAVIYREAFVPTLFADPSKQPVQIRKPYDSWWPYDKKIFDLSQLMNGMDSAKKDLFKFEYILVDRPRRMVPV